MALHICAMEKNQSSSEEAASKSQNYHVYKFEFNNLPNSSKGHLFEFLPGLRSQNGSAELTVISSADLPEDDAVSYIQSLLCIKYNKEKMELYTSGFEFTLNELRQSNRSPEKLKR